MSLQIRKSVLIRNTTPQGGLENKNANRPRRNECSETAENCSN